jgi:hypothetical protein
VTACFTQQEFASMRPALFQLLFGIVIAATPRSHRHGRTMLQHVRKSQANSRIVQQDPQLSQNLLVMSDIILVRSAW